MISNAHSILTGRADDGGRAAGPDIRIVDGRIRAIGKLAPLPGERVLDATDCVAYPPGSTPITTGSSRCAKAIRAD